ncbi:MAG: Maf family nucleotide pyrophosphatase [Tenacibaculum sp.]
MLKERLKKYHIILASASPRRKELLNDLGISFTVELNEIEENYPSHLQAHEITDYLAELKSQSFLSNLSQNNLVISSDTIVWLNNNALGKPKNYKEAFNMLKNLSGNQHEVITSICLRGTSFKKIVNDKAKVYFKNLTNKEISYYLEKHKPFDKAGAYGVQDWIGKIGINKIEGNYYTIMGFPLHKLYKELSNL